jgi:fluoroquinolone resistance protein
VVTADKAFRNEDWYAEELVGGHYTRCTFQDVDMTESSSRGAVFEDCVFGNVRFNVSKHVDSAFTACTFTRCNLFDAEFTGCKLLGSVFRQCSVRPVRVLGGDWSFVGLSEADLRGSTFQGVRMREVDLAKANCAAAVFTDVDLSGAQLHGVDFTGCDLRGSDITALDPMDAQCAGTIIGPDQAAVVARALGFQVRA